MIDSRPGRSDTDWRAAFTELCGSPVKVTVSPSSTSHTSEHRVPTPSSSCFVSHKVFKKSFFRTQFPYKYVYVSFIVTNIKNKLTDVCGNGLFQDNFINTFCEIMFQVCVLIQGGILAFRAQDRR